jgi:hypothetical protein
LWLLSMGQFLEVPGHCVSFCTDLDITNGNTRHGCGIVDVVEVVGEGESVVLSLGRLEVLLSSVKIGPSRKVVVWSPLLGETPDFSFLLSRVDFNRHHQDSPSHYDRSDSRVYHPPTSVGKMAATTGTARPREQTGSRNAA